LKILIALSRFPYPTDKGDKLRAWFQIQSLCKLHEVHLFCLNDEVVKKEHYETVAAICSSVTVVNISKTGIFYRLIRNVFSKLPFQVAWFTSKKAQQKFLRFTEQVKPNAIYCQLARMAEYCRHLPQKIKILDYQDAFSKGLERRIEHEPFWKKWLVRMEYNRLRKYEIEIFDCFSQCTIISKQDAELIQHPRQKDLLIIKNGVDSDYFKPEPNAKTIDLLFTGNMQYEPNVNCVLYIMNEVMPILTKEFPFIQLVVAGKNPAKELTDLTSKSIQLTGWVDDLRVYFKQARLLVAPMQIGVGMQNKLLEAMSMGIPVITSSLANNAIGATHGKHIWIADTPQKVAESISFLLNNTELAMKIGQNAREWIVANYSWDKQNEQLLRLFQVPNKIIYYN
jgi:sugar transferase (PEP-CTERM/EpsH1 system associated)